MADNEMRIKVKVDNSEFMTATNQMSQAQSRLANGASRLNSQASSGDYGAGAINNATGGLNGMVRGWVSASTGLGTFTAQMNPLTVGLSLLAKGIGAAGNLVKESVSDYATFENTLKQVQIIAGGTQQDMDLLSKTAIEVGGNTSKGAQEMADAMVDFAKLGFTATETAEAMTGIVYAAEASGSSVSVAAGIVASALNTWNLEASEAERVADIMAKTANETAADMTDLGYTFQYAGAQAKLGGASIEDLAAMTGIMADQGIKGSKAGTTLRTAFVNLLSPTDGAAAAMESLGVAWKDAEGNARPTMEVINDLQRATEGLSDLEVSDLSTKLFGKTGTAGMSMILKTTVGELDNLTVALENSTGTAEKQAAEMRKTLAGQLDQMGDSWDAIKLKIGKGITTHVALTGVETANQGLDIISRGLDAFAEGFTKTDKLLNSTNGFISGYKDAKAFGDAVLDTGQIAKLASDDFGTMFTSVDKGTSAAVKKYKELEEVTGKVQWLPDEAVESYVENNAKILEITGGTIADLKVKLATFQAGVKGKEGIGEALKESIVAGTPAMGEALAQQVEMVKQAEETKFNALATALANNDKLTDEQRANALSTQKTYNESIITETQSNNDKIWALYQGLDTKTVAGREESLAEIERLQEANGQRLVEMANITSADTLGVLKLQAESAGYITQQQKDKAITDSEETYTNTVSNAYKMWNESVTAINGMSDDAIIATGHTKAELIANATGQRDETVTKAEEMRTGTVNAINEMEVRATEADGKTITMETRLQNFDKTMEDLGALIRKLLDLWDAASKAADFMGRAFTDPFKSNAQLKEEFEADRKSLNAKKSSVTKNTQVYGPRKARGGEISGGFSGVTKGTTNLPGATARGVGHQLGQAGISQGVTVGEAGREVVLPVGNSTYMRPFAKAVADELSNASTGGGEVPMVVAVLNVDGREFARGIATPMSDELAAKTRIENRGKGKGI